MMGATTVRQAAVLAGGRGSRLGRLTASTPKPLLRCGDRPFLAWLLRELCRFGIEEVVVLTGHLGDEIEAAMPSIAAKLPKPLRIICSREEHPAGTGGALFHARKHLADQFLLCNGDSWQDFNVARLLADAARDPEEVIGRVVVRHVDNASRYGVVETDGDRITGFGEPATSEEPSTINAGLYLFDRRVLDIVTPICSLEGDVLPKLASRGALRGTMADGYFIDIGISEDLARAQTNLPARLLRPALFLDRDSVVGAVSTHERFTFMPGALTAIRTASDAGWHVFVVTDQSGTASDLYAEPQLTSLSAWMTGVIGAQGGTIDELRCCPFHPEAAIGVHRRFSSWREPAPGVLLDLLSRWQLDPMRCLLIGDRQSDLAAAAAAGIPAHLFPGRGDLAGFVAQLLTPRSSAKPSPD